MPHATDTERRYPNAPYVDQYGDDDDDCSGTDEDDGKGGGMYDALQRSAYKQTASDLTRFGNYHCEGCQARLASSQKKASHAQYCTAYRLWKEKTTGSALGDLKRKRQKKGKGKDKEDRKRLRTDASNGTGSAETLAAQQKQLSGSSSGPPTAGRTADKRGREGEGGTDRNDVEQTPDDRPLDFLGVDRVRVRPDALRAATARRLVDKIPDRSERNRFLSTLFDLHKGDPDMLWLLDQLVASAFSAGRNARQLGEFVDAVECLFKWGSENADR